MLHWFSRSDLAWKKAFSDAGLTLLYEQTQLGFPAGLFEVKMWVSLRFDTDVC